MTHYLSKLVGGKWQIVPMRWHERAGDRFHRFLLRHSKTTAWYWVKKEARRQLQQAYDAPTGTRFEIRKAMIKDISGEWAALGLHSKTWYELQLRGFSWSD